MGSRIRENPERVFECFLEVVAPSQSNPDPWIVQRFPESFQELEILKAVGQFCYPCEIASNTVQHFSFVLTNIDGKWTYGFCRHAPNSDTCFCILSYLPWHETFFKLLDKIVELIRHDGSELNSFLDVIYKSHIPTPGSVFQISYNDGKNSYDVHCPNHLKLPTFKENRNLVEYYSALDLNNMVLIFASLLNERRILITSSRLSRVSACVQAASTLIYPMHWQHIFIPVLPIHLIDYQSAPMPFLIGAPTPVFERAKRFELGEAVIVYADLNKVETPFDDLQNLPLEVVTTLKRKLKSSDSMTGDGIARAFMWALVQLIGGYRDALKFNGSESITFCETTFIQTRPSHMQPYLEKMLHLQIFQQFIEERLELLNSGKGLNDIFEGEVNFYAGKGGAKFKMQYKEWMGNFRKEGGAFLRTVRTKVKDKSKKAINDMRSIFQDNAGKESKYSSSNTYTDKIPQPRSAPSSPTLVRPTTIHGTKLSRSTSNQRSVVSYVRQREGPTRRTANGRIESNKMSVPYSPLRVGVSPTEVPAGADIREEMLSPNLDMPRLSMDLMGDLQDVIFRKCSLTESNGPTSPGLTMAPPIDRTLVSTATFRKPQLSPEISTVSHSAVKTHILSPPLPPPRTKRQCTSYSKDQDQKQHGSTLQHRREDAPLIRFNSDESDVVFDPLLIRDAAQPKHSESAKPTNLVQFPGPQDAFSVPSQQHNLPLRGAVLPPPSPSSMGLNNPVYFHVRPQSFYQGPMPMSPNQVLVNGNAYAPHYMTGSSPATTMMAPTYHNPTNPQTVFFPPNSPSLLTAGRPLSPSSSDRLGAGADSRSPISPKTLMNNNNYRSNLSSPTLPPLQSPPVAGDTRTAADLAMRAAPQTSYLHSNYSQRGTLPASMVGRRTKLFEDIFRSDAASTDVPQPPNRGLNTGHSVNKSAEWEKFE